MQAERELRWRAWMAAAQQGDSVAYTALLEELVPYVRGLLRARIFDRNSLEDVVQNVFVSLHRARHTYRAERPFLPWLNAVARNAVVDHIRGRQRRVQRELPLESEGVAEPSVEPATPGEDALAPELQRALERLPDAQRQAVSLIQLEGLTVEEAAARAGVTKGALKVRAHRGYRALRALLDEADA